MRIVVTKCEEKSEPEEIHKMFLVTGTVDDEPFSVLVFPSCGEYDYEQYPSKLGEDDEPLQVAIGQYFDDNNIDLGRIGR